MRPAVFAADEALPPDEVFPPWPGQPVRIDGVVTYVRRTPARSAGAEPALYVHGLGGSSRNWTDLAGLLAHRLDGEAIDLPGFGNSEPARRYSLAALAEHVVRYLEHTGRGPVHLFGNSLGGAVAVVVAGLRPDLVRTLTLISPAMPFLDLRRSTQARLLPLLVVPGADRLVVRQLNRVTPEEVARQVIETCFADPTRVCDQRRRETIEEIRVQIATDHFARVYLRTLRGLVTSFLRAYLPGAGSIWRIAARITAPTLVIGGRQDRVVDIRAAAQAARIIPDSRLSLLDGVGHVAQMEVPRTVARAVIALLDEAKSAGGQSGHGRLKGDVRTQSSPEDRQPAA